MKTLFETNRNGTAARATEFCDLAAALRFMNEKKRQGYTTTFPERTNDKKFIVYTWRVKK